MKKIVLGLMPILAASMLLAGCTGKAGGESSGSQGGSSEGSSSEEGLPTFATLQDLIDAVGNAAWPADSDYPYDPETDRVDGDGYVALYWAIGFDAEGANPEAVTEEVTSPILDEGGAFYNMVSPFVEQVAPAEFSDEAVPLDEEQTEFLPGSFSFYLTGDGAFVLQAVSYVYEENSISVQVMAYETPTEA